MNILLGTPLYSAHHWDAGHFFLKALNSLGHYVRVWDYRLLATPPDWNYDLALVLKGENVAPELLSAPRICYWPDALERTPGIGDLLADYAKVFTPVRPTPQGMEWLPSGWDPDIHHYTGDVKNIPCLYIGTNNSKRKAEFLHKVGHGKLVIMGNGWDNGNRPVYLHNFVDMASRAQVLVNIHQGPVGVNRKLFECCACGLTITDRVPGIVEILGADLAQLVSFETPEEGRELLDYWIGRTQEERNEVWMKEKKAIAPFTYLEVVKRILHVLPS